MTSCNEDGNGMIWRFASARLSSMMTTSHKQFPPSHFPSSTVSSSKGSSWRAEPAHGIPESNHQLKYCWSKMKNSILPMNISLGGHCVIHNCNPRGGLVPHKLTTQNMGGGSTSASRGAQGFPYLFTPPPERRRCDPSEGWHSGSKGETGWGWGNSIC